MPRTLAAGQHSRRQSDEDDETNEFSRQFDFLLGTRLSVEGGDVLTQVASRMTMHNQWPDHPPPAVLGATATCVFSLLTGNAAIDSPTKLSGDSPGFEASFADLELSATALRAGLTGSSVRVWDGGVHADCDCPALWQPAGRTVARATRTAQPKSLANIFISFRGA